MATPTDPLYANQWHFSQIGDIETIWDEYDGSGVHVAVYDDGVEYTHPDLAGNYDPTLHYSYGGTTYDPRPISSNDGHGTAVAGLIGAADNNGEGGVGVAHGVSLTGVNFLSDIQYLSATIVLDSLDYAKNFDVMNNSWGSTPNYNSWQTLSDPFSWRSFMNAEYEDVVEDGRGGLGTTIVQAAGNDTMNANGDGLNASRFTTTIAATDAGGDVTWYSNWGSSILIAAPAGSVTADLQGSDGYNSSGGTAGDYTSTFGGTSAATPVTSGVVALMLEANPGLGWRDVQNILAISAQQTGSTLGTSGTGDEVGDWGVNGAGNWNGGGMTFHLSYGHGLLDAYAAVRMAEVWTDLHGGAATSTNEQSVTVSYSGGPLAIQDRVGNTNGITEIDLTVTQSIKIEDIYVAVDMQHDYSSDLTINLLGPNGEVIPLMLNEGGATLMDSGFEWTFGVTAALGMISAGTWTVQIVDSFGGFGTGSISDVTIDFFGAPANNDDVHHFTQDLFDLITIDGSRATITDLNGGTDWLNFAAMGSIDITVRLDNKTIDFSSEPTQLTISGATLIENVVTGDGDDTIFGNSANNHIMGMRGDDTIAGGAGADVIDGGAHGANGDTASYAGSAAGVQVSLAGGTGHFGDAQGDTLTGIENVIGSDHIDTLIGDDNENMLFGLGGNDKLWGGAGDDVLDAGGGTSWQYLYGQSGDDEYRYAKEDGLVFVDVNYEGAADGTNDRVILEDLNYSDITVGYYLYPSGNHGSALRLMWNDGTSSGEFRVGQQGQHIEAFEFADGTIMTWDQFQPPVINGTADNDILYGTAFNDEMFGLGGNDKLWGGAGDDVLDAGGGTSWQYLYGQSGDDEYRYAKEDGLVFVDVNYEGAADGTNDRVILEDLNYSDITVGYYLYPSGNHGSALRLMWNDGTSSGEFRVGQQGQHIEAFEFADGTIMTWDQFQPPVINGTADNDILYGTAFNDEMFGLGGNDKLWGGAGDDVLDAGGGTSWQYLYGQSGDDEYRYAKEDGLVFVDVNYEGAADGTNDRVILEDLNYSDITVGYYLYPSGNHGSALRLMWNDGTSSGEFRVGQQGQHIEAFEFADGTIMTWDQFQPPVINGTADNDILYGTAFNDEMFGLGGNDKLWGGAGDDVLDAGGGTSWQYLYGQSGDDEYRYAKEDGLVFVDVNYEGAADGTNDRVILEDLNYSDITVGYYLYPSGNHGSALRLMWNDGTSSGEFRVGQQGQHIEAFEFADGTIMTWDDFAIF